MNNLTCFIRYGSHHKGKRRLTSLILKEKGTKVIEKIYNSFSFGFLATKQTRPIQV